MRFYFDRHGQYRGFSAGLLFWGAVILIGLAVLLAAGYQLFVLAPVLAVVGLAIWAWTWQIRRWRARRETPAARERARQG